MGSNVHFKVMHYSLRQAGLQVSARSTKEFKGGMRLRKFDVEDLRELQGEGKY